MKSTLIFFLGVLLVSLSSCNQDCDCDKESELVWYLKDTTDAESWVKEDIKRNTFGLGIERGLLKNEVDSTDGYILFPESGSKNMYLMSLNGKILHKWSTRFEILGGYLLEDGSVLVNTNDPDRPRFRGGGAAGKLVRIGWDGDVIWNYEMASWDQLQHHDFELLPNGNVLAIAWEYKSRDEVIEAGRNPEYVYDAGLWPDKIVELQPDGKYGAKVVWEWHMWDHLIQDFDPSKKNYGDPALHPELLDVNAGLSHIKKIHPDSIDIKRDSLNARLRRGDAWTYATLGDNVADVYHLNAVDYNAELDQIAISSYMLGEIFIIDHSTTTAEARTHNGGKSGMGGDILYRWGNPANYHRGDSTMQRLFNQHNIQWVEKGYPGEGNLILFNNNVPYGNPLDSVYYSAIFELEPPLNEDGTYSLGPDGKFLPENPVWTYVASDTLSLWSPFISGVQRLKNGNTYITEGAEGRFIEVTPEGEVVWEYLSEYVDSSVEQLIKRDVPTPVFMTFRSVFIANDHPGLNNKELSVLDPQPETKKLPVPIIKEPEPDTTKLEAGFKLN